MRHVIFGGDGFVGRHLAPKLVADGEEVVVADIVKSDLPHYRTVRFVQCDVTEAASVAWERGGSRSIDEWAESVRIAAVLEGHRLGRNEQAVARLRPAVERCRQAGRERAVAILTRLAQNLSKSTEN